MNSIHNSPGCMGHTDAHAVPGQVSVALLTGGADKPYAFGLSTALIANGAALDLIGNDELDCPEIRGKDGITFLNLRGSQRPDVGLYTQDI